MHMFFMREQLPSDNHLESSFLGNTDFPSLSSHYGLVLHQWTGPHEISSNPIDIPTGTIIVPGLFRQPYFWGFMDTFFSVTNKINNFSVCPLALKLFIPSFLWCSLSLKDRQCGTDIWVRTWYPMVSCCLHFDQLWLSIFWLYE